MKIYRIKNFISLFLILATILSISSISAYAEGEKITEDVVIFDDGSYFVTVMIEESITPRATTVNKTKRIICYGSDDEAKCALEIKATFNLNQGTSISCISATYKTYSYVSGWSIDSPSSAYKNYTSYAVATASGTVKRKALGITVKSQEVYVSITGYKDGTYK